jgi:hypothetical protein
VDTHTYTYMCICILVDSSPEEKEKYLRSFKLENCSELARIISEKLSIAWKIYDAKCGEIMAEANYAGKIYVFMYVCMYGHKCASIYM